MSPVNRKLGILAVACALLAAALSPGCNKKRGAPFDPDAGHPDGFFPTHPAEYLASPGSCLSCHGADLRGGISGVSCYSSSRDGQSCHPGGPGGHPDGWRATHTATDPAQAGVCASCHDNPANDLPPGCFNTSLCHGPKSGHPDGWRSSHTLTNPAQATVCAACHDNPANDLPPGCFNTSLCHGPRSNHPDGWASPAMHGAAAKGSPGMASCQNCHGSNYAGGTSGQSCFPCHGWPAPHGRSGWDGGGSSHRTTNTANASACALCHRSRAGTPGCFNNVLCHGSD